MRGFYAFILKAEAILAGVLLMAMVCLIFAGGVGRMMGHPLNWTIDLSTCFFAWACFLCADIAWRKNVLMSIDAVVELLPAGGQRALMLLNYLLISAFLVYVIYYGTILTWVSRARSFNGIPDVSYSWVTASFPVGAALLLMTTLLKLRDLLRSPATAPAG